MAREVETGGALYLPREQGESAADWQARLFDGLMRENPDAAFGVGPTQRALWDKRIDMALEFADPARLALDVGCGNGLVTRAIAEHTGGEVMGIDVSAECVAWATRRNAHPRVRYRQVATEHLELDEQVGLVTMFEVLEHVDDPQETLTALARMLAPGGHLVLSTPNRSSLNRTLKAMPLIRALYRRLAGRSHELNTPGHVDEYTYRELVSMASGAGLTVRSARGAVLLFPYYHAIGRLARSERFARLNVRSGDWFPRLANDIYLVLKRPEAAEPS